MNKFTNLLEPIVLVIVSSPSCAPSAQYELPQLGQELRGLPLLLWEPLKHNAVRASSHARLILTSRMGQDWKIVKSKSPGDAGACQQRRRRGGGRV